MSREIKFRAWALNEDKNCQGWCFYDNADCMKYINDRRVEITQFTGLLDKNGKEIFENDIVCWTFDEKTKKEIVFHEGCFGHFNFMGINNEYPEFIPIDKKRAEYMIVIGNIYQNPELLGGENE